MNYEFLDKQGLTKVINWIKNTFGRIKTINGKSPDTSGNITVDRGESVLASMIGNDGSIYEITNKSFNKNLIQSTSYSHIKSLNNNSKIDITDVLRFGYTVVLGHEKFYGYSPITRHHSSATAILKSSTRAGINYNRCILISPLKVDDFIVCLNNPEKLIDSFDLSNNGNYTTSTPIKVETPNYGYWVYNGGVSDFSANDTPKVFTDFWFKKDVNGNISNPLVLYDNKWYVINNQSFPVEPMKIDLKGELNFTIPPSEEYFSHPSYKYNEEKFIMIRCGVELYDLSTVDESNYNQVAPVFTFPDGYRGITEVFLDGDRVVVFVAHDTGMQAVLMNNDYSGFTVISDTALNYIDCNNGVIEVITIGNDLITYNYDLASNSYVKVNTIESVNLPSGIFFKEVVISDDNVFYFRSNGTVENSDFIYRKNGNTIEIYTDYDEQIKTPEPIFRVGNSVCYVAFSKNPVTSVNGIKAYKGNVNLESNIKQIATELDDVIEIGSVNLLDGSVGLKKQLTDTNAGYNQFWTADITNVDSKINVGEWVTISFDVQMERGDVLIVYDTNESLVKVFGAKKFTNIGTEQKRLSFSTQVADNGKGMNNHHLDFSNNNNGDRFIIQNIQIERGTKDTDWSPSEADRKARLGKLSFRNLINNSAQFKFDGNGQNLLKTFDIVDVEHLTFEDLSKITVGCKIDTASVTEGSVKIMVNYMTISGTPKEVSHTFDIKGFSGKLSKVIDTPECAIWMNYTIQTTLNGYFSIHSPFIVAGEYFGGFLPSYSDIINPPTPSVFMMNIGDNTIPTLNVPTDTFTPLKALNTLFKKGVDFEEISDGTNDLKVKYIGTEEVAVEVMFHGEVSLHDTSLNPIEEPFFTIFKDNEQGRVDYIQRYNYETNNIVQDSFILKCQPNSILSFRVKSSYAVGNCIVKHGDLIFKVL